MRGLKEKESPALMVALVEMPIGVFQGSFLPATVVPLRIKGIKPPPDKIEEERLWGNSHDG